jgi:hypothetical protein
MSFPVNTPGKEGARKLRKMRFAPKYFQNPAPKYCDAGNVLKEHKATAASTTTVKYAG